jgi:hypothetical protein
MENEEVENEDVAIRLLASSLTKDAQRWFRGIPDNHVASYEYFSKLFKNIWTTKKRQWDACSLVSWTPVFTDYIVKFRQIYVLPLQQFISYM